MVRQLNALSQLDLLQVAGIVCPHQRQHVDQSSAGVLQSWRGTNARFMSSMAAARAVLWLNRKGTVVSRVAHRRGTLRHSWGPSTRRRITPLGPARRFAGVRLEHDLSWQRRADAPQGDA